MRKHTTNLSTSSSETLYQKRLRALNKLGFISYQEYLQSKLWLSIKLRVFNKYPNCFICKCKATIVHHTSYGIMTLKGKTLDNLYSVCKTCHDSIEIHYGQKEMDITKTTKRMFQLRDFCQNKEKVSQPIDKGITKKQIPIKIKTIKFSKSKFDEAILVANIVNTEVADDITSNQG